MLLYRAGLTEEAFAHQSRALALRENVAIATGENDGRDPMPIAWYFARHILAAREAETERA